MSTITPVKTSPGALQGGVQGSNSSAHGSQFTDEASDQPQGHGDIRVGRCRLPLGSAAEPQCKHRCQHRSNQPLQFLTGQLQLAACTAAHVHNAAGFWVQLGDAVALLQLTLEQSKQLICLHCAS